MILSLQQREHHQAWVLLASVLIAMFIFTAWSLACTLWPNFTDTTLAGSGEATHYVWLDSCLYTLTDPDFRAILVRAFYFTVVSVAIEGTIGVLMALLLNQCFIERSVLRMLVILPWALPTIINATVWRLNFNPDHGSVSALFSQLGLIDSHHSWLGSPDSALHVVMLADVWKNYPLATLLVLAALQPAPDDLYEVAQLGGAPAWWRLRAVTFPAIVGSLGVALVLRTIDAFKVFGTIYVMTCGDPLDSTKTLSFFVYQESFSYLRTDGGVAYVMLVSSMCTMLIALYLFSLPRQRLRSVDDEA